MLCYESECINVAAEHQSNKMALRKNRDAQQEAVKILILLREVSPRQVWCHRRFVDLLPMCSLGAIKEFDVSSHSYARVVLLFLEIHSLADIAVSDKGPSTRDTRHRLLRSLELDRHLRQRILE